VCAASIARRSSGARPEQERLAALAASLIGLAPGTLAEWHMGREVEVFDEARAGMTMGARIRLDAAFIARRHSTGSE